ncbi:EpsG family protein [Sphingosinicella sp. BN140058]|uniref:EpsG family protein n=1 Tax=Sphingosinicella sp. BN140058 TaxID=1892855 RepID=UPI0010120C53|nr:EpsG family protein [Sphingosinicella sp. BN140058]QAY77049.1 EpsG family protein [Sphingosinicella sp. BN140058]
MYPYWLLFGLCAVGAIQYSSPAAAKQRSGVLLLWAALVICLMIGLRYRVGGDWENYIGIFEDISYLDFQSALAFGDPGYTVLNWAATQLGYGIWFVNLICAILFTWGLVEFSRAQYNPWLSFVVAIPYLIIVVAMGYTRQAVAIGFIMVALAGLEKHSIFRLVFFICLAAIFHKSAIVVLPLIGLATAKNRFLIIPLVLAAAIIFYYVFVSASIDKMVTNYVEEGMESQGAAIRVAMNLPPAALFLIFQKRFGFNEVQTKAWRNFSLASVAMLAMLVLTSASTAVDRIALYLIPLQIAVLARLPHAFGKETRNGPLVLAVIAYSAIVQFVWLNKATNAVYWVPYQVYPIGGEEEE